MLLLVTKLLEPRNEGPVDQATISGSLMGHTWATALVYRVKGAKCLETHRDRTAVES